MLATGLLLLVLSAVVIGPTEVPGAEVDVFRFLNDHEPIPFGVVWVPMQFGSVGAIALTVAVALVLRRRRLALTTAVAAVAAWWGAKAVKTLIERGRPGRLLDGVELRDAPTGGLGWVSGHAAVASALAYAAWPFLPRWGRAVAGALVVVVCVTRVHVGAHLPLDVVGGVGLGLGLAAVTHLVGISGRGVAFEGRDPALGRSRARRAASAEQP